MTTKGQEKPFFIQGEFNDVPGRTEQPTQCSRHMSVSSVLTDLIFRRNHGRRREQGSLRAAAQAAEMGSCSLPGLGEAGLHGRAAVARMGEYLSVGDHYKDPRVTVTKVRVILYHKQMGLHTYILHVHIIISFYILHIHFIRG